MWGVFGIILQSLCLSRVVKRSSHYRIEALPGIMDSLPEKRVLKKEKGGRKIHAGRETRDTLKHVSDPCRVTCVYPISSEIFEHTDSFFITLHENEMNA